MGLNDYKYMNSICANDHRRQLLVKILNFFYTCEDFSFSARIFCQ
jgi:hypothetical protein